MLVTKSRDLVNTDYDERTVNIVTNTQLSDYRDGNLSMSVVAPPVTSWFSLTIMMVFNRKLCVTSAPQRYKVQKSMTKDNLFIDPVEINRSV